MKYLIENTAVYRLDSLPEVEAFHQELKEDKTGELTSFSYKTKEVKEKGEIVDTYYLVTAKQIFNNAKEPDDSSLRVAFVRPQDNE